MADDAWTAVGIEVGPSVVSGAVVDLATGTLGRRWMREIDRPLPAATLTALIGDAVTALGHSGAVGVAFSDDVARTRSRIRWSGLGLGWGRSACMINRRDARVIGEVHYGAGIARRGLIAMVTFGPVIEVGLAYNGRLVPRSGPGRVEVPHVDAEAGATLVARERDHLTWAEWGQHARRYLSSLEHALHPDLFVLSATAPTSSGPWLWLNLIRTGIPQVLANLGPDAAIIGAAAVAADRMGTVPALSGA